MSDSSTDVTLSRGMDYLQRSISISLLRWSITIITVLLATRYALAGLWLWTLLTLLLGIFWWIEIQQHRFWASHILLIGFLIIMLGGVHRGFGAWWGVCGFLLLLSAWDLHHFIFRLEFAKDDTHAYHMERHHLQRLGMVNVVAVVCTGVAITLRMRLNFGLVLFLTTLAVVCLSRFIKYLRQESQ